jgi:Alw26I/Eco31I/Esp3I family type II restriction m6 adenine DNA methyltransferase
MPRIRRSADQHPELGLPEVRKLWQTEGLFSDHYLKARIRSNSWWPTDEETRPLWEFSKALYEKRAFALRRFDNEMGVRQEFIDKILGKLGFAWSDNLRLPETRQELEPDYLLYASEGEKETVLDKDVAHRYRAAISILEAKRFGHPLSQFSKSQQRYPHQQIRQYLDEAQVFSWGILTNGEQWRLYCRDTKPSHFFAINFELAIKSLEDFKFFFALFSPVAFKRDAQGECRLDDVRKSALDAQSKLEEDLRQRVFTIVEILANGFAEREQNAITDSAESRRELYGNCLIFLYRLLFVLYAEGRMLLPVERSDRKYYKDFSLAALRGSLRSFSEFDSPHLTRLNDKIVGLCRLINGTDEKLNKAYSVPLYNGGLFAPERHPLLEKWRVSDAVLADVLRGLMFNPQPERDKPALPIETVDFGDLRVQQLGSIYEGLLEHHFVREGARLVLKTDKAERKATGTYYTPDYIVKYIVEQTVGPLVAEIEEREPVKKARAAGLKDNSFAHEALGLNVLDPAMGSGHFLVEATTFLADEIAAHPTTQPLSEKSKDEDEIAHWRRRVVESCIYGVDLNPLAVELAKLSLWLTTIATEQPLNFLDHHFCCGNSLVGARIGDLGHVPELKKKKDKGFKFTWKITDNLLAAVQKAVRNVKQIEERASQTVGDVKNKEKIWSDSVRPALRPFPSVANLWVACFFDNDLPHRDYEALIELLDIHPDKIRPWKNVAEFQEIVMDAVTKGELKLAGRDFDKNQLKNLCAFLIRAEKSAHERRFFHWELEFPEVFFNDDGMPRESPGFDAVIGNPPYDVISEKEQEREVEMEKTYFTLSESFGAAVGSKLNFYRLFVAAAVSVLRENGAHGFIVPMALLGDSQAKPLRHELLTKQRLKRIEAFPQKDDPRDRVFFGAKLSTCVYVLDRATPAAFSIRVHPGREILNSSPRLQMSLKELRHFDPENLCIPCYPNATTDDFHLAIKLVDASGGKRLGEIAPSQQGELNLTTHARFLSDKPVGPVALRGANVGRYLFNDTPKQGEPKYLFRDQFLKAHGPDTKAFAHRHIRIGYQRGAAIDNWRRIIATIIEPENFCTDTINYISKPKTFDLFAILALLNSSVWEWRFRLTSTNNHVNAYEIDSMSLPRIEFTMSTAKRATQFEKAKRIYEKSLADDDAQGALHFVEAELQARRTDGVHDLLAFLAERMMAMNQQKRTTAKQFVTDLKDFHGVDVRALSPKTKLDEFWKLEAADVFTHLRKNIKVLATQNVRLTETIEENIRSRFSKAREKLLPLEAEIVFTDRMIDQIVYRLYELTADEIKIVEGAN